MKIDRFGSEKDHGLSGIEFDRPKFQWNNYSGKLEIKQNGISDFSTASQHSYTVTLTAAEVAQLLEAVIDGVESKTGGSIIDAIKPHVVPLQRLVATLIQPFKVEATE